MRGPFNASAPDSGAFTLASDATVAPRPLTVSASPGAVPLAADVAPVAVSESVAKALASLTAAARLAA
ncbi:hypothetical protein D3C81_2178360 [compost metagenome]